MNNVKISVVTVCYNAVKELERTMLSVLNQTYDNVEYIVIDGGSTDGTVEIIKKYADRLAYWVSEPDQGIYDAMNKGIKVATGEWINFMNAGDSFVDEEVLTKCFFQKDYDNNERVLYGDCIYKYVWGYRKVETININKITHGMNVCHQSVFLREYKSILFNLKYRLAADYDQLLTLYLSNQNFHHLNVYVALENIDEGETCNNFKKSKKEAYNIQVSLGLSSIKGKIIYYYWILRFYLSNFIKKNIPNSIAEKIYKSSNSY